MDSNADGIGDACSFTFTLPSGDTAICEGVDTVNTNPNDASTPTVCLSDLDDTDGDGVPDILDNVCALNIHDMQQHANTKYNTK